MKILMRADTHYSIGRVVEYEEPKFTLSQVRLVKDNSEEYFSIENQNTISVMHMCTMKIIKMLLHYFYVSTHKNIVTK